MATWIERDKDGNCALLSDELKVFFILIEMAKYFPIKDPEKLMQETKVKNENIRVLGYGSYDENNEFREDLSQLKYYNPPPKDTLDNLACDLTDIGESPPKRDPYDLKSQGIDDFLKWITQNFEKIKAKPEENKL